VTVSFQYNMEGENILVFIGGERIGFMASFHLIEAYSSVL
jgi:hypothetical protein